MPPSPRRRLLTAVTLTLPLLGTANLVPPEARADEAPTVTAFIPVTDTPIVVTVTAGTTHTSAQDAPTRPTSTPQPSTSATIELGDPNQATNTSTTTPMPSTPSAPDRGPTTASTPPAVPAPTLSTTTSAPTIDVAPPSASATPAAPTADAPTTTDTQAAPLPTISPSTNPGQTTPATPGTSSASTRPTDGPSTATNIPSTGPVEGPTTPRTAPATPATPAATPATGRASGLPFDLGVFGQDAERTTKFTQVVGKDVDVIGVFPTRDSDGWKSLLSTWWLDTAPPDFHGTLDVGMPLWPDNGDVATAAAGGYNEQWKAFATVLSKKYPTAYVRPGWEMNLPGWSWSANPSNAEQWKAAFRQAYASMKSVAPGLRIEWTPNEGPGQSIQADLVYPGDDAVDLIGLDSYDWDPGNRTEEDWKKHLTQPGGYQYWINFAKSHNKKMTMPEWGVVTNPDRAGAGGDNPFYIQKIFGLVHDNPGTFVMLNYFDETADYLRSSLAAGQAPQAAAAFRDELGRFSDPGAETPTPATPASGPTSSPTRTTPATTPTEAPRDPSPADHSADDSGQPGQPTSTWGDAEAGHGPLPTPTGP